MARKRAPTFDDQRAAILNHAAGLFARQGYFATSMNDVARECGMSKPSLYHYYRDKYALLLSIVDGHVTRLVDLVRPASAVPAVPERQLERLVVTFLEAYADAQSSHRVLTEDVKFLKEEDAALVLQKQRLVVRAFANAITLVRPALRSAQLESIVTMLLFGMLNWMFTWVRPGGALTHSDLAPIVCELFLNGVTGMNLPPAKDTKSPTAQQSSAHKRTSRTAKSL